MSTRFVLFPQWCRDIRWPWACFASTRAYRCTNGNNRVLGQRQSHHTTERCETKLRTLEAKILIITSYHMFKCVLTDIAIPICWRTVLCRAFRSQILKVPKLYIVLIRGVCKTFLLCLGIRRILPMLQTSHEKCGNISAKKNLSQSEPLPN
jgi:hypothetical protein